LGEGGVFMDNQYTRKELKCPLLGDFCNGKDKNCDRCIMEEEEFQKSQSALDCLRYSEILNN
jgi:hypothetical protein